jgi:hypothetical protein
VPPFIPRPHRAPATALGADASGEIRDRDDEDTEDRGRRDG